MYLLLFFFFFQAEDGIRDGTETGVQTCALPIFRLGCRRSATLTSIQPTATRVQPMAYDLLIRNGTVIDGTGAPPRHADVAVAAGKIAEIGNISDGSKRVIDAADCVVAPGFVDPHTHYDAQICWDPAITPSSWHGVTTVVMGN